MNCCDIFIANQRLLKRAFVLLPLVHLSCGGGPFLYAEEDLVNPPSIILGDRQREGTSVFAQRERIVFDYETIERGVEFPKRIQNILFTLDEKIQELEEFIENEYRRTPKHSDTVTIAFQDFYRSHIFTKALREMRRLSGICSACKDFVYYNNEFCFLEGALKDDQRVKKDYYSTLSIDIRNFLMYLETRGFKNETKAESELYQREILSEIALLRQDAKDLLTDLRIFYIGFLELIESNARH